MQIERQGDYWVGRFQAMASPCELLMEVDDAATARTLLGIAAEETLRIEHKFSRYRADSFIQRINGAAGEPVAVDAETAGLLDYAALCHELSGGLFDITSGVLRRIWHFDGSDRLPTQQQIDALLPLIGWHKVRWEHPLITLAPGMEIDLGGIGKEYAVDRCARLLAQQTAASVLLNYGGDLYASGPRRDGTGWRVGLDDPEASGQGRRGLLALHQGGLATSGDARRYLLKDGIRYGHILDPTTGRPVADAPRSVTVVADSCTEAGMLATLAMLKGREAEAYLQAQGVRHWCIR